MADLFGEPVDGRILLNMKIRQEVIGKMTGLHRVTVVRELNKLKDCRLLFMEDGNYWIPNMALCALNQALKGYLSEN